MCGTSDGRVTRAAFDRRVARETPTVSPPWSGAHPRQAAAPKLTRAEPHPESCRAFVAGAGWSRQEWVNWVSNTLSRDIFTNAAATRDGLPTSKMTAEPPMNHPDGTGDGSKASILVQ